MIGPVQVQRYKLDHRQRELYTHRSDVWGVQRSQNQDGTIAPETFARVYKDVRCYYWYTDNVDDSIDAVGDAKRGTIFTEDRIRFPINFYRPDMSVGDLTIRDKWLLVNRTPESPSLNDVHVIQGAPKIKPGAAHRLTNCQTLFLMVEPHPPIEIRDLYGIPGGLPNLTPSTAPSYITDIIASLVSVVKTTWPDVVPPIVASSTGTDAGGIWLQEQIRRVPYSDLTPPFAVVDLKTPRSAEGKWGITADAYEIDAEITYVCEVSGPITICQDKVMAIRRALNTVPGINVVDNGDMEWSPGMPANQYFAAQGARHWAGRYGFKIVVGESYAVQPDGTNL